jgi:acyl-CoA thioesterase-1
VLLAGLLTLGWVRHAAGAEGDRCERFAADSTARAQVVTGAGERVVVIGDSWSAGLGLDDPGDSWPSRLDGSVHVAGFSGSGFSALASDCGAGASFAARAGQALRGGADLVVVEGGLNDYDRTGAEIRAGFARLMQVVRAPGRPVVVVGPPAAPSRAGSVPRVDALLAVLADRYGASYVSTTAWHLDYSPDGLHLTEAGHRAFGDAVARQISALL